MGIKIFVDTGIAGVPAFSNLGSLSANGQKLTTVLGNVLPGNISSVATSKTLAGVRASSLPGTLKKTNSHSKNLTGAATTGAAGALSTGSATTGWGFNLSGMEWASPGLRYGTSSAPNRDYTVPRDEYIAYIANRGFTKTRLPIQWELLQPVLARQGAVSTVLNAYFITQSGQLAPRMVRQIQQVLDAHATAGIKCYLDIHNYCRYQDFIYNADGTVPGFTVPGGVLQPYSSTASVQTRIFSSASSPSLTKADFSDLWKRIAQQWKGHAGLGGYMLMNEPHDLDANGTWPAYAQAAITAIRAVDALTPIYIGGNNYSNSTTIGTSNPGFPLNGNNLVYEAHMYLDASSSGQYFDYDLEVAKGFSVGESGMTTTGPWKVGVNVHTGGDSLAANTAFADVMKNRNLTIARVDLFSDPFSWANVKDQITKIKANGGSAQGVLSPPLFNNHTPTADYAGIYTSSYNDTYAIVDAFKDYITDFEILNEVQQRSEMPPLHNPVQPYGTTTKYQGVQACEWLCEGMKGMIQAVHDVATANGKTFRTMMGFVGRDWGWGNYMISRGINWELTTFHCYPYEGEPVMTSPQFGLPSPLSQMALFGKPITVNELNAGEVYNGTYTNVDGSTDVEAGFRGLRDQLSAFYTQNQCTLESIVLYELIDHPDWGTGPAARFGLMYDTSTPKADMYLVAAYAGATLSNTERQVLINKGLLTGAQIDSMVQGTVSSINANTGFNRLKYATDWATSNNQKLAVTECGMPLDDPRWVTLFKGALDLAWAKGAEWYTWMGGDHWPIHSYPINYVPGWYQGQTMEPKVGGVMRQSMGLQKYTLYDASQSYSTGTAPVTVTVFQRGYLASPLTLTLTKTSGTGTLGAGTVTLPAGANTSATYTYTPVANEKAVITYSGAAQVPPARSIYSYTDPVTLAATNLADAGMTLLAKYGCAKWVSADGMKDYMGASSGVVAADGEYVRAISDSGFASTAANTFEMTNWIRTGADYGTMTPVIKSISSGRHRLDTSGGSSVTNWGTTMAQHVNPQLGNLNKVLACYWAAWDPSLAFTSIPTYFNLVYLFHLKFSGPGRDVNNNGDGTLIFLDQGSLTAAQIQSVRNRGQKVVMTCGGASNGYNISNRSQSTNFVNSFISIVDGLGGVDGIDFNNFEAGVGSSATELIWIVQQLRARYGANFLVTAPPDPNSPSDKAMLQQMYNAGCLSWASPQFYDWTGFDDSTLIATRLAEWRDNFGGNAAAVLFGCPANNQLDAGPNVAKCASSYDAFVAANPSFRGAFCWNAQINESSSTTVTGNANLWGLWCKKQDIKETSGGEAIQPNGKEVVLFDIHDPHFVVAAVEVIDSSSDGAIFATNKAEADAHSELGLASGAMPTAKFQDYNGNTLDLRGPNGLGGGAHVLSMKSAAGSQILRVDKTQVASGARALSANSGIGSNTHTIGWRFYNYFERGTPGCYIYGVVAGKGNPTSAELTVIERYLGNTYAGLSL